MPQVYFWKQYPSDLDYKSLLLAHYSKYKNKAISTNYIRIILLPQKGQKLKVYSSICLGYPHSSIQNISTLSKTQCQKLRQDKNGNLYNVKKVSLLQAI
jgi:hypothetical protein